MEFDKETAIAYALTVVNIGVWLSVLRGLAQMAGLLK